MEASFAIMSRVIVGVGVGIIACILNMLTAGIGFSFLLRFFLKRSGPLAELAQHGLLFLSMTVILFISATTTVAAFLLAGFIFGSSVTIPLIGVGIAGIALIYEPFYFCNNSSG